MKNNLEIAQHLFEIASMMRLDGQNSFSCSAFEKSSDIIKNMNEAVATYSGKIPGVGSSIAAIIKEFVSSGNSSRHQELSVKFPPDALKLMVVPGIGPKKALKLYQSGITSLEQLKSKAEAGELDEKLTNAVKFITSQESSRIPLPIALDLANHIKTKVDQISGVVKSEICGSLRRRVETVKDIDIVACVDSSEESLRAQIAAEFSKLGESLTIGDRGRTSIRAIYNGTTMQADLWIVDRSYWGSALNYATGSKNHNVILRGIAKKRGLLINEFGIFENDKRIGGDKEEDIYNILNVPFHPPELREDVLYEKIPELLTIEQIQFDGHSHTSWSPDGDKNFSIIDLAKSCKSRGYKVCCVTDHSYSQHFRVATGDPNYSSENIDRYIAECREAEQKVGIRVLAGLECDILVDGSLQWEESNLKKLDYVLGAIHRSFNEKVTERYVVAMESGLIDGLAHPMTRLFGSRPCADINWDKVIETALKTEVALEINGAVDRLDLESSIARKASLAGVKLFLSSDAHNSRGLEGIDFAVMLARKAGLTKDNLLELTGERRTRFSLISPGIGNRKTDV